MSFSDLQTQTLSEIRTAKTKQELEDLRVRIFGRKGEVTKLLRSLKNYPQTERATVGAEINALKKTLETALQQQTEIILTLASASAEESGIDITLPGRSRHRGSLHPVSQTLQQIEEIFLHAGYQVVEGPEIEDDYHNFEALNIASSHPARAMHDTFYLKNGHLLRTHTSPVQIRTMEVQKPPIRIICPGKVYRRDFDRTHTPMFHQVEGLVIDKGINFAHLKNSVISFVEAMFGKSVQIRFRASYFPFTEPSAEVDVLGEQGWSEVMGCGVVHPNVLKKSGIDPSTYSGFAFGFGVDRLAMLKFGIKDLRTLFENDVRFLRQFG